VSDDWEAFEQRAWELGAWAPRAWRPELTPAPSQDARINRVRVKLYTKAACALAIKAQKDLEKAVDALERARKRAEVAARYRDRLLTHAEEMIRCYSAADPEWDEEVAACLEELVG
jgi:hypothetical protein